MTRIVIGQSGMRLCGRLIAADAVGVELSAEAAELALARVRVVVTDARPADARHVLAASEELSADKPSGSLSLLTRELAQALQGLSYSLFYASCVVYINEVTSDENKAKGQALMAMVSILWSMICCFFDRL